MISTNTIKPKGNRAEKKKRTILSTNKIQPKALTERSGTTNKTVRVKTGKIITTSDLKARDEDDEAFLLCRERARQARLRRKRKEQ